jgi:hypothetical protein
MTPLPIEYLLLLVLVAFVALALASRGMGER